MPQLESTPRRERRAGVEPRDWRLDRLASLDCGWLMLDSFSFMSVGLEVSIVRVDMDEGLVLPLALSLDLAVVLPFIVPVTHIRMLRFVVWKKDQSIKV